MKEVQSSTKRLKTVDKLNMVSKHFHDTPIAKINKKKEKAKKLRQLSSKKLSDNLSSTQPNPVLNPLDTGTFYFPTVVADSNEQNLPSSAPTSVVANAEDTTTGDKNNQIGFDFMELRALLEEDKLLKTKGKGANKV